MQIEEHMEILLSLHLYVCYLSSANTKEKFEITWLQEWETDAFIFGNKKCVLNQLQGIMALYLQYVSKKERSHLFRVINRVTLLYGMKNSKNKKV